MSHTKSQSEPYVASMNVPRPYAERSDYELVQAYLAGDLAAFDALYCRCRKPLYSYLNRLLVAQPDAVDDLYQRTWEKALRKLDHFRDRALLPWLLRIAHNTVIDLVRRKRFTLPLNEMHENVGADLPLPGWDLQQEELRRALREAILALPLEQRQVVAMRQRDMAFHEIAAEQACSINTAMGRMRYALTALRKQINARFQM